MSWLGLDIGGANLKSADGRGFGNSRGFALWLNVDQLVHELRSLIAESPPCDHIAATMTGELADCFEDKRHGITTIVDALEEAADGRHTRIYLTNSKLVTTEVARRQPELAAASNWHALARFASRYVPPRQTALLLDVGSTTSDLIPLSSTGPCGVGQTDTARLVAGELVYTGVRRSPLCGIAHRVPYRGVNIPLAQELFATTLDVNLILDRLPEDATCLWTADGRPATKKHARARLARMICADHNSFHHRDAIVMAEFVWEQQLSLLCNAAQQIARSLGASPQLVILSGGGEFLAECVVKRLDWSATTLSLSKKLGAKASLCAPAHALAVLAAEAGTRS